MIEIEGVVQFYEYDIENLTEGGIELINTQVIDLEEILRKNDGKKIKIIYEE
ncbi:TPA: hypothetical protein PTW06_003659 [Clostridium botulinum]|nr:hypothetical protein [Clostridium botulinum]HDK7226226.1 hypothetical protein [Clostridium botulinum]HDK7273719.1 hypothetical protein [Clostridium botulinum]HDK7307067.1 hypothetical protein [Clostridium botulinum]